MNEDKQKQSESGAVAASKPNGEAPRKRFEDLPPAAQRALKEAEARRKEIDKRHNAMNGEVGGRGGLDPVRYEDWEIKGLAIDF
ncbi:DUF1674 domain-containing protein [Stappia sp. GBMRC 2046]|uniref:DUF1674 domain-containing protein n=1 Tax=Stappia sediminis TaxID=2692190 RepID=A0A7X3LU81_9HYPH|nr:DUF1674 domain-containing protein [Stappia sediminis]MXN65155.1 DUF1674 domain-containing protein [Stappia sediminis]